MLLNSAPIYKADHYLHPDSFANSMVRDAEMAAGFCLPAKHFLVGAGNCGCGSHIDRIHHHQLSVYQGCPYQSGKKPEDRIKIF
jgi:hypothetical protein